MLDLLHRTVVVLNDSDGHADKRTRTILAQQFANQGQVVIEVPLDLHLRPGGVIDVSHEMSCDLVLSASASVILAPGVVRPRIDTKSSLCLCHSAPWPTKWGTSQLACPSTTSLGYREQIAEGKARQEAGKRYGW